MTTLRCPLSCEHCLAAGDDTEDMGAAESARLIEQVAVLGVEEFLLTGGEPLTRPDLPEIIGMLRANGVRWSLNTALMPDRRTRAAIEQWPPGFVAVSMDGPEEIHDAFRRRVGAFRGAMDSMAYFARLVPGRVAAGTTVTTRNFQHLPATFGIVLRSGVAQWGLHLLVPEGRAAKRKDLFLSRRQLKDLLGFAASKRNHFPVTLADEIGYCGFWEPFVRSEPFFCGAGRAQCVVLPDGEVVPCTTLDRSASAGNAIRQPLREIWETGFAALRSWRPEGKCRSCGYAVVCEGGCWLQRRHGTGCFRHVWNIPRTVTAAGLAVCLGLAASGQALGAEAKEPAEQPVLMTDAEAAKMQVLQSSIVRWYASQFRYRREVPDTAQVLTDLGRALPDDPGARYFLRFAEGKLPAGMEDHAKEIAEALQTKQRSLCLIGLAWRDVTEWCIEGEAPERRTDAERKALRDVTVKLGETAEAWRIEIFSEKLDPFLRRPLDYRRFFQSKAGPTALERVSGDLVRERWGGGKNVTEEFLAEHPYAETMNLKFTVSEDAKLLCLRGGKTADADGTLRVFDLLLVPEQEAGNQVVLTLLAGGHRLNVTPPPETELTYGDVLRLAHEQNPKFSAPRFPPLPLALPELIQGKREFEAKKENAGKPLPDDILRPLVDLYLF
jgi:radical SAM protein with 4Fe4S-binding SPASM domain